MVEGYVVIEARLLKFQRYALRIRKKQSLRSVEIGIGLVEVYIM